MIDWEKPIRTKRGEPARFLGTCQHAVQDSYIVVVRTSEKFEVVRHYNSTGTLAHPSMDQLDSVENAPELKRVYLVIHDRADPELGMTLHLSDEAAVRELSRHSQGLIKLVEWEL